MYLYLVGGTVNLAEIIETLILAGYPASLGPLLLLLPPHSLILSTLPPSDKALPGFAQNICCEIIAQDNCIPEILFKT